MLAIVESPYQLCNVLKLIDEMGFDSTKVHIFVRKNGNRDQELQFDEVLKSVNHTSFTLPSSGFYKLLRAPFLIAYFLFKRFLDGDIVFGDARSIVCKPIIKMLKILNAHFYLVDDGLYIINYHERIKNCNCTIFTSIPFLSDDSNQAKIINFNFDKFDYYERQLSVSFIGQHLVELGILELDSFLNSLEVIKHDYVKSKSISDFRYYAHRSESAVKLKRVEELGYNVIKPNVNIESYFEREGAPRSIFISYYSTALLNLKRRFTSVEDVEFFYIKSDINYENNKNMMQLKQCFDGFDKVGIKQLVL